MANQTPTLRKFLHSLGGDDTVKINGVTWRAEQFLQFLILNNDARLSENVVEAANGTLTLYAAGMGAVDSTTPSMVTVTHKNKTG